MKPNEIFSDEFKQEFNKALDNLKKGAEVLSEKTAEIGRNVMDKINDTDSGITYDLNEKKVIENADSIKDAPKASFHDEKAVEDIFSDEDLHETIRLLQSTNKQLRAKLNYVYEEAKKTEVALKEKCDNLAFELDEKENELVTRIAEGVELKKELDELKALRVNEEGDDDELFTDLQDKLDESIKEVERLRALLHDFTVRNKAKDRQIASLEAERDYLNNIMAQEHEDDEDYSPYIKPDTDIKSLITDLDPDIKSITTTTTYGSSDEEECEDCCCDNANNILHFHNCNFFINKDLDSMDISEILDSLNDNI